MRDRDFTKPFLAHARRLLSRVYLPRIVRCLRALGPEEIWWRPNPASNSVGNLVLHLEGNVRQWIISGLGGAKDTRHRDREFRERGPIPRRELVARLEATVRLASRVLAGLSANDMARTHAIQDFRVSGLEAVFHVAEHFSHHAGQIILITKMHQGRGLGFTHLPGDATRGSSVKTLPAL